ncbi:hypothetical protein ABFX02_13G062000 [Erythranthe guttata]
MGDFSGLEENDYVSLKNLKVEFRRNGDGEEDGSPEEAFAICFWIYIHSCASFPSDILVQKQPDVASSVPFLRLDEKKKMKLFPLLFLHEDAPNPDNYVPWAGIPCASTEIEFPLKKWVHVGCEVLRDVVRLNIDGEIVGEKTLTCSVNKDLHAEALKRLYLECPFENENMLHGYVHQLDVLFATSAVKNHYAKDPPVQLLIDHSSTSEIEEECDGVWSIVGGKASCRRSFSLDVTLLNAFGRPVNKEFEVVASLLYADNAAFVENTGDFESPLLMICDGVEYGSHDRPCKIINGQISFKLKISQLSSKCDNRLFVIRFEMPNLGRYPFFEAVSLPIRCVSRSKTVRKLSNPNCEDGSMGLIPNLAKPNPSSKRIKLGNDIPFSMSKQANNKAHNSRAWTSNKDKNHGMSMSRRVENGYGAENNNSSGSDNSEATNSDPKSMLGISNPIPDLIIFKYCMGGPAERCQLLKEIAVSASEVQIAHFAKQVSLFSGCSHHQHQIKIAQRLVKEGIEAWTSVSENNNHVSWDNLVFTINQHFIKIVNTPRSLTNQDFECLRRIGGCRDTVSQEEFERIWSWLYPVAFTLSQSAVNEMWNSVSPVWIEGLITKEEAESIILQQCPGTFVLRFPTSRSWPHPDAGNLVVTYVGTHSTIHHRLLSFDFINGSSSKKTAVKPLQDLLLQEPELSRLGRMVRSH